MSRLRDGLLLAVGSLTALRVPPPREVDRAVAGISMTLAWVPGVLLALCWAATSWGAGRLGLPSSVAGLLAVAVLLLMTRAFHADGLADTVDGLTASYSRERTLEVMRTGDVGPAGAAALVVVLGLDAASFAALHARGDVALGAVAVVASRAVLSLACRAGTPAARPEGLGALVAGTVPLPRALAVLAVLALAAGLAAGVHGAMVVLACTVAALVVVAHVGRRTGGLTGDVLGAVVEASLAVGLVAALAASFV